MPETTEIYGISQHRMIELERADAARKVLDEAASMLEEYSTNELYHKAFKLGAILIREMKIEKGL